jgi:hypothetical protein
MNSITPPAAVIAAGSPGRQGAGTDACRAVRAFCAIRATLPPIFIYRLSRVAGKELAGGPLQGASRDGARARLHPSRPARPAAGAAGYRLSW